jgi:fumarate hydratase class II
MRREFDSLGDVQVPANRYWGAQTQRSLEHFNIGNDRMPKEVYYAYGYVKKAAAIVNTSASRLPEWKGQLIQRVCDEVISGALDEHFPLYVWQTGSGTQSNMNVNEVISNRCIQLVGGTLGSQTPIHPNDHVNMGQSNNDTFPTAMHIAAYTMATEKTIPALKRLRAALDAKSKQWADVVKIGRTHLEDAVPLTVGQEWSGYMGALDDAIVEVEHATDGLLSLAMGGTAVGTGLNAPPGFGEQVASEIAAQAAGFEAILTFGLVLMVLNLANGPKLNGPFVPLAVGAYIMAWGTMGGPFDGASMNPARSFGPDVAIGNLSTWWVYLIGPVVGAVIAVGVAYLLRGPAKAQEAIAAEGTPLDQGT